jgi:MOSC domain-containing protein YiiM
MCQVVQLERLPRYPECEPVQGILQQINRSNGGVPKYAVQVPVMLTASGIEGDRQNNLRYHGGPDKAVLMIAAEVIEALARRGFPLVAGSLGENLTSTGLDPHLWRSGQQYRIGEDAVIELTTLRVPCSNLHRYGLATGSELYDARCKAGDITSPYWGYGGFYARVRRGGLLIAGAPIALLADLA